MGYAEFCARIETDQVFARWFKDLDADISGLVERENFRIDRLVALEAGIADLIDFLDPENIKYPLRQPLRVSEVSSEKYAPWGSQWWTNQND
jgi:hypothetical protein